MRIDFDFSTLSDRLLGCLLNDAAERAQVSMVARTLHDALSREQLRRQVGSTVTVEAELPLMNFDEMLATLKELASWASCLEVVAHTTRDRDAKLEVALGLALLHEAELAVARERDSILAASTQPLN